MVGFRTEQLISTKQRSRLPLFLQAFTAIPVRLCALQVCFEDERFRPLFSILTGLMGARGLCRMVSHFGSDAECLYSLMMFGIPPTTLPIRTDGTVDTTEHLRMLSRQAVEEGLSCSFTEDAPVVLRGKEDVGNTVASGRGISNSANFSRPTETTIEREERRRRSLYRTRFITML